MAACLLQDSNSGRKVDMGLWANIQTARCAEEGSSFVEYALVISFIVLSSLAALRMIGVEVHLDVEQLINLFR